MSRELRGEGQGRAGRPRTVAALVRHGVYRQPADTPSAWLPHPLTEEGRAHARAGATKLEGLAAGEGLALWPVVDASRLLRAWQTATVLAELVEGLDPARIEQFEALNERSVGSAANLSLEEIGAVIDADPRFPPLPPGWKSSPAVRLPLPGAESLLEAGARVATHLEWRMLEVAAAVRRDTLKVFVGHGAAFRHAAAALGVLGPEEVAALSMHHGQPVLLERHADGCWTHLGGDWKVRAQPRDDEEPPQ